MDNKIEHKGIVEQVNGTEVRVRILQSAACSGCHAAKSCMAAEAQEKIIDCVTADPMQVGDEVTVQVEQSVGWLAVLLSFVLPFCIMMLMLWLMGKFFSEGIAGTIALCSLLPYYGIVALFRKKIKKRFVFTAKK